MKPFLLQAHAAFKLGVADHIPHTKCPKIGFSFVRLVGLRAETERPPQPTKGFAWGISNHKRYSWGSLVLHYAMKLFTRVNFPETKPATQEKMPLSSGKPPMISPIFSFPRRRAGSFRPSAPGLKWAMIFFPDPAIFIPSKNYTV